MPEDRPFSPSEQPRAEPEIIPPGQPDGPWLRGGLWSFTSGRGGQRIYLTRLGPFSTLLLVAAFGLVAAMLLIVLLGAFLIWIPILGLLVAAGIISALVRGHSRR